jgi:hypothetical protein
MKYTLKIRPSIDIDTRFAIENTLKLRGFNVTGGGQTIAIEPTSESFTDISFEDRD